MTNKCPVCPKNIDRIMSRTFNKNFKVKLPKHKEIADEISKLIEVGKL